MNPISSAANASRKALQELQKTAIIGLSHSPDTRHIEQQLAHIPGGDVIHQQLANRQQDKAQAFMETLLLAQGACEFSCLPVAGRYDELPEVPPEQARVLNADESTQLNHISLLIQNHMHNEPGIELLDLLLSPHHAVLPDRLLISLLQRYGSQTALQRQLLTLISRRSEWLLRLDPQLIDTANALPNPALPHPAQLVEWLEQATDNDWQTLAQHWSGLNRQWQKRYLLALNPARDTLIRQFLQHCWSEIAADGRERLLPLLGRLCESARSPSATIPWQEALWQWLQTISNDRSAKIRLALLPLINQLAFDLPETCQDEHSRTCINTLQAELNRYLPRTGAKGCEPLAPEELTPELIALGISNSPQYARSVAAGRLVQLVELAGIDLIARHLHTTPAKAVTTLAKSAFGDELSGALLAISLRGADPDALQSWCKHSARKQSHYEHQQILLQQFSSAGHAAMAARLVSLCDTPAQYLVCQPALAIQLARMGITLSEEHSEVFLKALQNAHAPHEMPLWATVLTLNSRSQQRLQEYREQLNRQHEHADISIGLFTQTLALRAALQP